MAQQPRLAENRFVIHYRCPSGDTGSPRFGLGSHYCLGAALSRLDGVLALPALFDRFPTMELVDAPSAQPKPLILRGHTLAVRW